MKYASIATWLLAAIPLVLGSTALVAACGGGDDGSGSDDGGAAGASAFGGSSGDSTAGGNAGAGDISGAGNGGGAAGASSDSNCAEGLACTSSCSGTCPDDSSATYPCECQEGSLRCDTSGCGPSVAGCVPGAGCTDDCSAPCPGDSSTSYDCTCQTRGSLSCDMSVCLGGETDACPRGTATGETCDPASDSTCVVLDSAGTSTCSCDATSSEWQCVSG